MSTCNNPKCKKEIRNYYTCNKCGLSFCTNNCLTQHTFDKHLVENTSNVFEQNEFEVEESRKKLRQSTFKSIFLKNGEFKQDPKNDPYYNYENLEIIKKGKSNQTIGVGAFGEVYLAQHKRDGTFFAIKVIEKNKIIETGATMEVIYREINIHRRIFHENIVRLYSNHEDEDAIYLIMEYVNNGSLFNLIKKTKGLEESSVFKYFIQAVSAVNFLHNNNLIHRDIKPENLLIGDNDVVKLCDFGWCVDLAHGNRVTFCGTYEYMAPEIIKETPYDQSIDVWSLGILLYELLHGYSPFRSTNDKNEEHYEIFKNVLKYNFKIEKNLSPNCCDLLTSILLLF